MSDVSETTRSVVVEEPGRHRLQVGVTPWPGPGEALVRVAAAGICGSDRELLYGGRPEGFARYPVTPGHEWSGTVAAVGDGVDTGLVDTPVVGEGYRGCLGCDPCRAGAANLCERGYDETGFTRPGAFADHLVVPARLLHPLNPDADLRAAALLEPAAVAAAAVRRLGPRPGETAAVVGAGTLGALALRLLAATSPARLVAVDVREEREATARLAGATAFATIAPADRFDMVVETAGAPNTARTAVSLVHRGGRAALVGIPAEAADAVPTALVVTRNLTLNSVFGPSSADWTYAVRAFNAGVLNPAPLITHEPSLTDYAAALDLSGSPDAGKVLLRP